MWAAQNETEEATSTGRQITLDILINVIIAVGVIGNMVALGVLCDRRMRRLSTYIYLKLLTIDDTLFLVNAFMVVYAQTVFSGAWVYSFDILLPLSLYTLVVLNMYGNYLVVAVAFDRYVAVTKPLKTSSLTRCRSAHMIALAMWLVCCVYNAPLLFAYRREPAGGNSTELILVQTELAFQTSFKHYQHYLTTTVASVVPILLLAAFSLLLICSIRRRGGELLLRVNNRQLQKEVNVTRLVVFVLAMFLVANVPATVYNFELAILGEKMRQWDYERGWYYARDVTMIVSCATHWLMYLMVGQKFRELFKEIVLRRPSTNTYLVRYQFRRFGSSGACPNICPQNVPLRPCASCNPCGCHYPLPPIIIPAGSQPVPNATVVIIAPVNS